MAETRTITIIVRKGADQPSQQGGAPDSEQGEQASRSNGDAGIASWLLHQAYSAAVQELTAEAQYQIGAYYSQTDDYIGERNMMVAKAYVGKVMGIAASAYAGARAGSAGGAAGALIGAAAGAGAYGVSQALEYWRALGAQSRSVERMDAQLGFQRARSGWSLTAGSIGEDR